MSWPSAYGYKYTPIGLRQREKKDDTSGTRSICTTVHLPQGGHLLDIERQYGMDGSMSKRIAEVDPVDNYPRRYLTSMKYPEDVDPKCMETQNVDPAAFVPSPARAATAEPPSSSPFLDAFEPRAPTDFERQADDIIANFRARQGLPLESPIEAIQFLEDTYGKYSSNLRREGSSSVRATAGESKISSLLSSSATTSSAIKEETSMTSSSSRVKRAMRKAEEESYY